MSRTVLHARGWWKFSLVDTKKIFCRRDLWSKISHVLVVQHETFSHKFTTHTRTSSDNQSFHVTYHCQGRGLDCQILDLRLSSGVFCAFVWRCDHFSTTVSGSKFGAIHKRRQPLVGDGGVKNWSKLPNPH